MTRLSSSREATLSISRDCKLWIPPFHQNLSKSISETEGCAKMNIKGRKRKRKEKGSAILKLWTEVHGLSRTQCHRFSKTSGTGFCRQHRIYP
jgi:hypothetical protein